MANFESMQEIPLSAKPDYVAYCNLLESRGWVREQLTLDELNTNMTNTYNVAAGATAVAVQVVCPAGQKISIMGAQQVMRGADARTAHALRMRLLDTADAELPLATKIRITKEKTSEAVVQLARCFYADVNLIKQLGAAAANNYYKTDEEWYRFKQGVELNGQQYLRIYIINPPVSINAADVTFALDMDLWTFEG
jgi:hypothetical protein